MNLFRNLVRFAATAALAAGLMAPASAQVVSKAGMTDFDDQYALSGGSIVVRSDDSVVVSLITDHLIPGDVATMWVWVFNNPDGCNVRPCTLNDLNNPAAEASLLFGDGRTVRADGTISFAAEIRVGDTKYAVAGPGIGDPYAAEVKIIVRSHGQAIDGRAEEQRTQVAGGCDVNFCYNAQMSIHVARGNDTERKIEGMQEALERIQAALGVQTDD